MAPLEPSAECSRPTRGEGWGGKECVAGGWQKPPAFRSARSPPPNLPRKRGRGCNSAFSRRHAALQQRRHIRFPRMAMPACKGGRKGDRISHHGRSRTIAMPHPRTERARRLRRQPTDAERHLWHYLHRRQLGGHKFRRQYPVGPYIADFACVERRLIVELDGGQHGSQAGYDSRRDAKLHDAGFRVVRYWNHQVLNQTQAVLEDILRHLSLPSLTLPQAGQGRYVMKQTGATETPTLPLPHLWGRLGGGNRNNALPTAPHPGKASLTSPARPTPPGFRVRPGLPG